MDDEVVLPAPVFFSAGLSLRGLQAFRPARHDAECYQDRQHHLFSSEVCDNVFFFVWCQNFWKHEATYDLAVYNE